VPNPSEEAAKKSPHDIKSKRHIDFKNKKKVNSSNGVLRLINSNNGHLSLIVYPSEERKSENKPGVQASCLDT